MLSVVTGKPGSGKTAHVVQRIVSELVEWVRYELRTGEPFTRRLYTNIELDIAAVEQYVSGLLAEELRGKVCDIGSYIVPIEFGGQWWKRVPNGAWIVVDEVHEILGAETDGRNLLVAFRNYCATHRHSQHDLTMITQHMENVSIEVLRIADSLELIQNFKSGRIPVLNIPLADIDVVRSAWGWPQQGYRVSIGRFVRRAVVWEGATTHVMGSNIWSLYNSHSRSQGVSFGKGDRPSLGLSRLGSIRWFMRRHCWHLGLKVGGVVLVVLMGAGVVTRAPVMLSKLVRVGGTRGMGLQVVGEPAAQKRGVVAESGERVTTSDVSKDVIDRDNKIHMLERKVTELEGVIERMSYDQAVMAVFDGGVLLKNGMRLDVGDSIVRGNGDMDKLVRTNARCGLVIWESGLEVRLR